MSSRNLYILEEEGIAHSCCLIKLVIEFCSHPSPNRPPNPPPGTEENARGTDGWFLHQLYFKLLQRLMYLSLVLCSSKKMPADSLGHIISLSAGDNSNEKRRYICITDSTNRSTHLFGFINSVYPEGVHGEPVEFWKVRLLFFHFVIIPCIVC